MKQSEIGFISVFFILPLKSLPSLAIQVGVAA
jgi:hypothetical protein